MIWTVDGIVIFVGGVELGETTVLSSIWKSTRFGDRGFLLVGLRRLLLRIAVVEAGLAGMLDERRSGFVVDGREMVLAFVGNDKRRGVGGVLELECRGMMGCVAAPFELSGGRLICDSFSRRASCGSCFGGDGTRPGLLLSSNGRKCGVNRPRNSTSRSCVRDWSSG